MGMGNFQVDFESKTSPTKPNLSKGDLGVWGERQGHPNKAGLLQYTLAGSHATYKALHTNQFLLRKQGTKKLLYGYLQDLLVSGEDYKSAGCCSHQSQVGHIQSLIWTNSPDQKLIFPRVVNEPRRIFAPKVYEVAVILIWAAFQPESQCLDKIIK